MQRPDPESGNVIFFVLLAVVLIGLVTAAMRSGGLEGAHVDREQALMQATQVRQYAAELERGVVFILSGNASEMDLRFAHTDAHAEYGNDFSITPSFQVFHPQGGGAEYRLPPGGVNDGSKWEFYGNAALPGVGSDNGELVAVLPNMTEAVCTQINDMNGYDGGVVLSDPDPVCMNAGALFRFSNTDGISGNGDDYDSTPNAVPEGAAPNNFSLPAMEACVTCQDGTRHFYHVLHAR